MSSGKIILILSCMFSGKTETLLTYARRYTFAKKKIVLVKYSKDNRYNESETNPSETNPCETSEKIISHNKTMMNSTFSCCLLSEISETNEIKNSDVILIDEIQFFADAPVECEKFANNGKIVIVSGLNGNFKREEFPVISKLLSLCEEVKMLSSVCSQCGEDAHFTHRNDKTNDTIEVIGGIGLYEPRCRKCFFEK